MKNSSMRASRLGTFVRPDTISIERLLPAPIETVWEYLVNPARLKSWLAGGVVDLKKGGAVALDFDLIECPGREGMGGKMSGIITALDPPRLLSYTWKECNDGGAESLLTFKLTPGSAAQTLLTLTHTLIRSNELTGIAAGWHVHVDVLSSRLEGGEPANFRRAFELVETEYKALLWNQTESEP